MMEILTSPLVDEWRGLYKESWKGLIHDDAFAHPAKFSRALVGRVFDHVIEEGWAKSGDRVIDPFGGVALGALPAMQHGLYWHGCELEQKFVDLGNQNIALWNERFSRMPNWGTSALLNGDSRKLAEVLRGAECCVSSPPFVGCGVENDGRKELLQKAYNASGAKDARPNQVGSYRKHGYSDSYGDTEGQLGAMEEGNHSIAITSPPFPQPYTGGGGINVKGYRNNKLRPGGEDQPSDLVGQRTYQSKGGDRTGGNLETLDAGGFDCAVSSPPYEGTGGHQSLGHPEKAGLIGGDISKRSTTGAGPDDRWYSNNAENVGNQRGETFWSASRLILEQLHQVIVPGGHAVFVVKAFVRDKKIVDFPGQWAQLCEAVGFKLLHDHHALLTEHYGTQGGFESDKEMSVARKSFFRRLAESKGSPKIDFENVLCFERP